MGEPFVGEIRMFGGSFAPSGWAFCSGQLMPISENETLFNLIGTTYGGDGQSTFALPDLQGRIPVHAGTLQGGSTYQIGENAGSESVTLTINQIPTHNHPFIVNGAVGTQPSPQNNFWAAAGVQLYADPPVAVPVGMRPGLIPGTGGSQPHENMGPCLVITFIISLFGVFPHQ